MDAPGLTILMAELRADCVVAADAGRKAAVRLRDQAPGYLEACAYELALRADRLTELAGLAERLVADLPGWCAAFEQKVRAEQHWERG